VRIADSNRSSSRLKQIAFVMPMLPRIAITMGDPAGIGPELCLRLLTSEHVRQVCSPLIFGDMGILQRVARKLGWPLPDDKFVRDLGAIDADAVEPGIVSAKCGRAAYSYIVSAIDEAMAGKVDAIATGPIHKEALHAAGIPFPGHTEILAERTKSDRSCMMLTSEAITCSLVTVHVGYREVPALLTTERIIDTIDLTARAMHRMRGRKPRLLVCGLNPHAGEHGLFGSGEEERIIMPAIADARSRGIDVAGPLPPDTAFLPKYRQTTDAYICMYHDQGLIPLKALAFDEAVNVTLGLPIVRTSVDHGTAFDIAWRGIADVSSFIKAVELAVKLSSSN
jgi:4-phospho-D-threonate 3-dehydrogenase / 4-phospho-D-erythronate 3-dehydrogenase